MDTAGDQRLALHDLEFVFLEDTYHKFWRVYFHGHVYFVIRGISFKPRNHFHNTTTYNFLIPKIFLAPIENSGFQKLKFCCPLARRTAGPSFFELF